MEVRTRAASPLDWAITQENLGMVLESLGDRHDEPAELYTEALACYKAALEVFEAAGMDRDQANCTRIRARIPEDFATDPSADS